MMNRQAPISAETTGTAVCAAPEFQRLSVNINDESAEILRGVRAGRGIDTTEAVRRAIALLGMFERVAVAPISAVTPVSAKFDPAGGSGAGSTTGNEGW